MALFYVLHVPVWLCWSTVSLVVLVVSKCLSGCVSRVIHFLRLCQCGCVVPMIVSVWLCLSGCVRLVVSVWLFSSTGCVFWLFSSTGCVSAKAPWRESWLCHPSHSMSMARGCCRSWTGSTCDGAGVGHPRETVSRNCTLVWPSTGVDSCQSRLCQSNRRPQYFLSPWHMCSCLPDIQQWVVPLVRLYTHHKAPNIRKTWKGNISCDLLENHSRHTLWSFCSHWCSCTKSGMRCCRQCRRSRRPRRCWGW